MAVLLLEELFHPGFSVVNPISQVGSGEGGAFVSLALLGLALDVQSPGWGRGSVLIVGGGELQENICYVTHMRTQP